MNVRERLEAAYPYKTELHAHTKPCSPCGDIPAAEVVRIYASLGCHSVTITNHITPPLFMGEDAKLNAQLYLADYMEA